MVPTVLVAIPTYLRPKRLRRALKSASIAAQAASHRYDVSIVVIDNDVNRSAEGVATQFEVTYVCEPNRGLSIVRNRALQLSREFDALVFFDDDEWVAETWLLELIEAAGRYNADVVQGPVETVLPPHRPWQLADPAMFRTNPKQEGEKLETAYTGNILITTRLLRELNYPEFSLRLNLAGGEDAEFFSRLHSLGARIFHTTRAVAYEDIPPGRFKLRSVAKRSFTQGAAFALTLVEQQGAARTSAHAIVMLGYSSSKLLRDLVLEQKLGGESFKQFFYAAGTLAGLFGYFPTRYKFVDADKQTT